MIRVCVSGARGRMGLKLTDLVLESKDLCLTSAIERPTHPDLGIKIGDKGILLECNIAEALEKADVLIDFSVKEAVVEHAQVAANLGKAVVTGITGLDVEQMHYLQTLSKKVPLVYGSNMSKGVFVLTHLVREATKMLGYDYDVEILEIHHRYKADSPSGTALQLADTVRTASHKGNVIYGRKGLREQGQVGVSSVRGGDVMGEHKVMFLSQGEQIILTHRATSREHFCQGVLEAVYFVFGRKKGFYTMEDVFYAHLT